MKNQFLHEHHNRQDKRFKADYREEMAERRSSEGTSPRGNSRQPSAAEIWKLRQSTVDRTRDWHFVYEGRVLKLSWKLDQYAKFNSLDHDSPAIEQEFRDLQKTARADWKVVEREIRSSKVLKNRVRIGKVAFSLGWFIDWNIPESVKMIAMQKAAPTPAQLSEWFGSTSARSPIEKPESGYPEGTAPPSPEVVPGFRTTD